MSFLATGAKPRPHPPARAHNFAVNITVDAKVNRHPIDPRIYGAAFVNDGTFADLGATINRWGGNATSRHNWDVNTTNRAKDYYFENQPDAAPADPAGKAVDDFVAPTLANGLDALITIPMMGMLPFDNAVRCGYTPGNDCCEFHHVDNGQDCGNGRSLTLFEQNGQRLRLKGQNNLDYFQVFPPSHQGDWVEHLKTTFSHGVHYYALDNEPSLWSFDHWDVHPDGATTDEVWNDMATYGPLIKATEPAALLTGPEEWGWDGYFYSGADQENYPNGYPDQLAHGNIPYTRYLLQQARKYEETNGTRILDFFTLHFYPQGGEFSDDDSVATQQLRNRSTRGLWDPSYVNESYIGTTGINSGIVRLIPLMREWVNNDYPGTKIGLTEYNWGDESNINGATAQADVLGILGREGADMAVRWTTPPSGSLVYNAFKMYRSVGGGFGDLSVDASSATSPDDVASFAALRSSGNALTVMIIQKQVAGEVGSDTADVTLHLDNFTPSGSATRWQLGVSNVITNVGTVAVGAGNNLALSVAPQTITLLVIQGSFQESPTNLVATANPASATLIWSPPAGASTHHIERKTDGGAFAPIVCANLTINSCTDTVSAGHAYLYRVQAESATGTLSGFSNVDQANTLAFTNQDLCQPAPPPNIPIRAIDFAELRTAINTLRTNAGIGAATYTHASPVASTTVVTIEDIRELRLAINQMHAWLSLPNASYLTDPVITKAVTTVKRQHVCEIRDILQ